MNRNTVFYTGAFKFPDQDAGAKRVMGIAQALRQGGFEVIIAGTEEAPRCADRQDEVGYMYRGFRCQPERQRSAPRWLRRGRRLLETHFVGLTAMKRLRAVDPASLRAVIAYNSSSLLLGQLIAFGRRHGIPVIADTPEWYDPRQLALGRLSPFWLDSEVRMRLLQPRVGNIIAISRFLESYYARTGCHVLRVPPLVDMSVAERYRQTVPDSLGPPTVLRLAYAGVPGKKDLVGNVVRAVSLLGADMRRVSLKLVGPTRTEVQHLLQADASLLDRLADRVVCCGRHSQMDAMALVAAADFTVLLRPEARFTRAGFPTKLVESLSLGVPVMANLTGDIGEYLADGQQGIVLPGPSAEACCQGLRRLLTMPKSHWIAMRTKAWEKARAAFAFELFTEPLCTFVDEARIP